MNDRIKEIKEQVYKDVIANTPSWLVTKEIYEEKFAELLIQECIDICIEGNATQMTSSGAAQFIKLRFGIG